jgi:alpha-glucosidase
MGRPDAFGVHMPEFGLMPKTEQPWTTLGAVQSVVRDEQGVQLDCDGPCLAVRVLAPNLLRVRVAPSGTFAPRRSWAVNRDDAEWPAVSFEVQEHNGAVELIAEQMRVQIQHDPCRIMCFDHDDRPFAHDADPGVGWRTGAVVGWKQIEASEHFYGFGERTGLLDKEAEIKTNWAVDAIHYSSITDNMYQAIPFFIALRPNVGYGLFFNTTYWSQFDLGATQPGIWHMETHGDELDYYVIYGPTPAQIVQTYTELTGRMPLPPRWALGYHQSRWSYESEDVVGAVAHEFRERRLPCDVIQLDIDYMQGYRVFTWSPKRFPEPAKLVRDLAQDGFKTVTIIDPGVKYEPEADYHVFDEGLAHDYFVRRSDGTLFHGYVWPDKAVFPDFLRPDIRAWWGEQHRSLTELGVAGIWNDMNEPAMQDRPFGDGGVHISLLLDAPQGPAEERTTHAELHNLYGLMMARACREALNSLRASERSFVLTRSGFAGIQRWAAVWTGDNQSQWEHLEMSLPMLCNLGLSGVAFAGSDIGGFAGNATAELFARWMQVGLLYPFMRGHSALGTAQHEPWVFGERVEQICREYLELRYQLLPYLYTLCWEASLTGAPVLRPLLYHYPNDPQTYALHDQVLLGPSLMAAPILRPGVDHRSVYLPDGAWYDWWSGECHVGPTHILAQAPLERMPLYVRAGAAIPMSPVLQYTDERPLDELRLQIWPGAGEWTLYEDDGKSFDYQQGMYATTTYRVQQDGQQTVVEIGSRKGQWTPPKREVVVEVVGRGEQRFADDGVPRRLVF